MRYILKGRGLGKTTDLIRLSAKTGIPIICVNPDYVFRQAIDLGLKIPNPISPYKLMTMIPKPKIVYIDELGLVLKHIIGCSIDIVTDTPFDT